jgi:hypothetical protein
MTEHEWDAGWSKALGMRLGGDALGEVDAHGTPVTDDNLLLLINAHHDAIEFRLPPTQAAPWELLVDTHGPGAALSHAVYRLGGRSLALFREPRGLTGNGKTASHGEHGGAVAVASPCTDPCCVVRIVRAAPRRVRTAGPLSYTRSNP